MKIDNAKPSNDEFEPLWEVAHTVARALKPIAPPPAFRAHLRDSLQIAARHQHTRPLFGEHPAPQRALPWVVLLVAALLGCAIGFTLLQLRARRILPHRRST